MDHEALALRIEASLDRKLGEQREYIDGRFDRSEDKAQARNDRVWTELHAQGSSLSDIRERTATIEGKIAGKVLSAAGAVDTSKFWNVMEKMATPLGWGVLVLIVIAAVGVGINLADLPFMGK